MPEPFPQELRDHLALALIPGLGPKLTAALLSRFASPADALKATPAQLRTIPHIGEKIAESLSKALRTVDLTNELKLLEQHNVQPVPLGYPAYPPPLAGVSSPPPLLYLRGQWTDADADGVAIVGSRACTAYGKKMTDLLARGLTRAGITVISGLARGIDAVAHRSALDAGGRTIAVLAGGLSAIYPPEHADLATEIAGRGALITETPMTVAPQPGMFPARNRLISGLSRAVVVVEANIRSGALITARHAAEQGREVYAIPGPVDSPASAGCLELIRAGARLARSADDILEDLKGIATPDYKPPKESRALTQTALFPTSSEALSQELPIQPVVPTGLDPVQMQLWELLATRRHGDDLTRESGLGVSEISTALMRMEMKRLVRRLPGNFYERR